MSRHAYTIGSSPARIERDGGARIDVTADQLALLDGMALATLRLEPGAVREPHWHPNATELSYCLEGSVSMTIVESGGRPVSMSIEPGDLAFVPSGLIHHIENRSDSAARFVVCFSHERYEDLNLSNSVAEMPAHVLRSTFGADPGSFDWIEPLREPAFIDRPGGPGNGLAETSSPYRYQLEKMEPEVENAGGSAIFGRADYFAALEGWRCTRCG